MVADSDVVERNTARLALLLPLIDTTAPTAAADAPYSVSAAAGYTWVILPGEEHPDYDWGGKLSAYQGSDVAVYVTVRVYKCILLVGKLGTGGPGDLPAACKPLLSKFVPFFKGRAMLQDPAHGITPLIGTLEVNPEGDAGTAGIEYAGDQYVGVVFSLEIQSLVEYNIIAGG